MRTPPGIENGIGAAPDDHAAFRRKLAIVAVTPDVRECLEVRRTVFRVVRIVPETNRHGRKRLGANQLAFLARRQRAALAVKHLDLHAKAAGLNLTPVDRACRVAQREAGDQIRPARDGGELYVGFDVLVYVVESFFDKGRAGGEDGPQSRQAVALDGLDSGLLGGGKILCARAENRDLLLIGHVPEPSWGRVERRAVEQNHRGADSEAADHPVPHHPAAGGEVEDAVFGPEIVVKQQLLQVLQERPPRAVNDALGLSGRTRGIHDVDRVVERQRGECKWLRRTLRKKVVIQDCAGQGIEVRIRYDVGDDDDLLNGGNVLDDLRDLLQRIKRPPVVLVSGRADDDLGLNLPEAVEDPCRPKSGEQDDQTAPMLVVASIAITVSAKLGMKPATRSSFRTPACRSAAASRAVSSCNSE